MLAKQALETHKEFFKAIHRSQHCNRNWDLSRSMPQDDIDILLEAATQCPSKQNAAFYKVHVFTNREQIEKIHSMTTGFHYKGITTTNSQMLANLVLVFEAVNTNKNIQRIRRQYLEAGLNASTTQIREEVIRDQHMAVGVAAGYLNLLASQLGYGTGCCACFDPQGVAEFVGTQDEVLLMMGIGFAGTEHNRRVHHLDESFKFPAKPKEPIDVVYHQD